MEVMVSIRHGIPPFSPILANVKILSNVFYEKWLWREVYGSCHNKCIYASLTPNSLLEEIPHHLPRHLGVELQSRYGKLCPVIGRADCDLLANCFQEATAFLHFEWNAIDSRRINLIMRRKTARRFPLPTWGKRKRTISTFITASSTSRVAISSFIKPFGSRYLRSKINHMDWSKKNWWPLSVYEDLNPDGWLVR